MRTERSAWAGVERPALCRVGAPGEVTITFGWEVGKCLLEGPVFGKGPRVGVFVSLDSGVGMSVAGSAALGPFCSLLVCASRVLFFLPTELPPSLQGFSTAVD